MKDKVIRSVAEFEKRFFPETFKHKMESKQKNEDRDTGTGLATEFLDVVRRRIKINS